jgi:hypothetical protein
MITPIWRTGATLGLRNKLQLAINRVRVSEQERNAAQLSRANVQKSLDEFHRNGLVILENAVGNRSIEHVHERMLQDFKMYRNSLRLCWNQGRNSVSQPTDQLSPRLRP